MRKEKTEKRLKAQKPYRPETGIDGAEFMMMHCRQCKRGSDCAIPMKTLLFTVHEDAYPKEWVCDDGEMPTCRKFENQVSDG